MKAVEFRQHCEGIAHWVDWSNTRDQFMRGDPEVEVRGMQAMVGYIKQHIPGVPVAYLDNGFPYPVVK